LETPDVDKYHGRLPLVPPTLTPDVALMLGMKIDDPVKELQKLYDGTNEHLEYPPEEDDDEDDQYNSDGSVDFEEVLRQEIKTEVKNKLESLENRVKIYFDEHNHVCKQDFR